MSIKSDKIAIKGKLSFMHLLKTDDFNGKAKPKYSFSLTNLSDAAEEALVERFGEQAGMGHKRVKFNEKYPEAGKTTKFSSFYPMKVTMDGRDIITQGTDDGGNAKVIINDPIANNIGYGSEAVVTIAADKMGNPRVQKIDIVDLVTFEAEEEEDDLEVL